MQGEKGDKMTNFAENLKKLRKNKGVHQKEISKQLGISVSGYSLYETGQREPDIEKLIKLADYFNITIDELLKGVRK